MKRGEGKEKHKIKFRQVKPSYERDISYLEYKARLSIICRAKLHSLDLEDPETRQNPTVADSHNV